MKILLTTDVYAPTVNGVVTSLCTLRAELERCGHTVRVLTLSGTLHTERGEDGGVLALGSLDAGRVYPGARLRRPAVGAAVDELIRWRPDVVHSQSELSTFPLAVRIARACAAPLIHTYHTVYEDYTHYFSPSRRWGRWLVRTLTRRVAAKVDLLIAPTAKVEALLRGYGVAAPIAVLPTGIDLQRYAPAAPGAVPEPALRAALGIPAENRVLLSVGRLAREKEVDALLACRAALGAAAPVTLLVVGDGPDRPRLEAQAAALGLAAPAVVFAGMARPARVPACYRLGDVYLSWSASETQGLTTLEALAAGLPLVCRADACLAGVLQSGENGWQVQSPAELAARVQALLQNDALRGDMGAASRARAQAYSARAFGQAAAGLYRAEILKKHGDTRPRLATGEGKPAWNRA